MSISAETSDSLEQDPAADEPVSVRYFNAVFSLAGDVCSRTTCESELPTRQAPRLESVSSTSAERSSTSAERGGAVEGSPEILAPMEFDVIVEPEKQTLLLGSTASINLNHSPGCERNENNPDSSSESSGHIKPTLESRYAVCAVYWPANVRSLVLHSLCKGRFRCTLLSHCFPIHNANT
jgi:hypothetical protein